MKKGVGVRERRWRDKEGVRGMERESDRDKGRERGMTQRK